MVLIDILVFAAMLTGITYLVCRGIELFLKAILTIRKKATPGNEPEYTEMISETTDGGKKGMTAYDRNNSNELF